MRVFISAPYRGEVERNKNRAAKYAIEALLEGHIPFCPHWAFDYLRNEDFGNELALYLCCRELENCDEVWQYGEATDGMAFELAHALGLGIPVVKK